MSQYLRRLATTGAAYTASSVLSKLIAVALLPVYTRYLTPADYGAAEVLFMSQSAVSGSLAELEKKVSPEQVLNRIDEHEERIRNE